MNFWEVIRLLTRHVSRCGRLEAMRSDILVAKRAQVMTLKISDWSKSRCPLGNEIIHPIDIPHAREKGRSGQSVYWNTTLMHLYDVLFLLSLYCPQSVSAYTIKSYSMCLRHSVWQSEMNESWPATRDTEERPVKDFAILRTRWIKNLVRQTTNRHERPDGRNQKSQEYHQIRRSKRAFLSPAYAPPLASIKSLLGLLLIWSRPTWHVRLVYQPKQLDQRPLGS